MSTLASRYVRAFKVLTALIERGVFAWRNTTMRYYTSDEAGSVLDDVLKIAKLIEQIGLGLRINISWKRER